MQATRLTNQEIMTLEAYWTILRPLTRGIRQELARRLENSVDETLPLHEARSVQLDAALDYVKSLSVYSGEPVPDNESSIGALIDEKYRL